MAEALVTVLLDRLATLALQKVGGEFKLVTGLEKQVKSLTRNLEAIQAVLEDAEQRQVEETTVRRWLTELTEVSDDMDNVLDEWITRVGMRQMEKQEKHALAIGEKVLSSASSFFSGSKVRRLIHARDIAGRIKDLNEKLALIDKEKQSFNFQTTIRVSEPPARRETTSLPIDKTFGRDKEKNLIVSKLLSESSQETRVPLVIPIVGMGGMGKTCLAQLVYNDDNVKGHFDKRIWVCVSDPFEEIKISKAIIEGLDNSNTSKDSNELQTLMQSIFELIKGKRFLLVLDDVWNPNSRQWEEFIKPLRNGAMGSRVLVTTRKEEVTVLMNATTQMIPLKKLSEAFCLSLFYYNANIDEYSVSKEIRDIGLEIVKRCNGLPLAAKTLGSLMRNKKIHEWRALLKSKTWELKEVQQDVFRPLLLSYHDLTPATKRCLLYCVAFPKDYVFHKIRLIELWMSQDYLHGKGNKGKMTVGQDYFDDLVMRSFFQDVEVKQNGDITCKIHDIVHDFLQYLTTNESLILDFESDASERTEVSTDKVHHLALIHARESNNMIPCLPSYKKLRTFTVIDPSRNFLNSIFELIVQMKCLRTLNLCQQSDDTSTLVKIPEMIDGLMHLRYLDLSFNTKLVELSNTMGSLYNLQTLRLVGCINLKKIDVGRLINLRHLHVEKCIDLKSINGIENLRELQILDEFRAGARDEENKLEDLAALNKLQGVLDIWIVSEVAKKAIMLNKAHLLHLTINFFYMYHLYGNIRLIREILNNLEPHPDLESLCISHYIGVGLSDWVSSLHGLRELTLRFCPCIDVLPPLGKLASLESLRIENLDGVEKVGVEFLGIDGQTSSSIVISFPKLKQLHIQSMVSWKEWEGVEDNITVMPCLSELTIDHCDRLKALPDFLWKTPLQKLVVRGKFHNRNWSSAELQIFQLNKERVRSK